LCVRCLRVGIISCGIKKKNKKQKSKVEVADGEGGPGGPSGLGAALLVLGRQRWACKAALPLAVPLARAIRPSG
jgi:hypothetical protein